LIFFPYSQPEELVLGYNNPHYFVCIFSTYFSFTNTITYLILCSALYLMIAINNELQKRTVFYFYEERLLQNFQFYSCSRKVVISTK